MLLIQIAENAGRMCMPALAQVATTGTDAAEMMLDTPGAILLGLGMVLLLAAGVVCAGVVLRQMAGCTPSGWRERTVRLACAGFSGVDSAMLISALFMLYALSSLGLLLMQQWVDSIPDVVLVIVQSAALHWGVLAGVLILIKRRGLTWQLVFGRNSFFRDVQAGVIGYLALLPFILLGAVIYRMVLNYFGVATDLQDILVTLAGDHTLVVRMYLIVLTVLIAPLAEEILFRGICLPFFCRKLGGPTAIVVTALLFAAIHFHIPSFAPIFILALGLGTACLYTRSLVVPVVMHALFNTYSVVVMLLLANG